MCACARLRCTSLRVHVSLCVRVCEVVCVRVDVRVRTRAHACAMRANARVRVRALRLRCVKYPCPQRGALGGERNPNGKRGDLRLDHCRYAK